MDRQSGIIRVLLIEDNPGDARLVERMLADAEGTGTVSSALELVAVDWLSKGLERLADGGIDVVLLDLGLPDSQGLDTLVRMRAHAPDVPAVALTGADDDVLAMQAVQQGAQDYLIKGQLDSRLLARTIRYAIERHRLTAKVAQHAKAAQASESRFRKIIEENADGIVIVDGDGIVRLANPAVEAILGRPRQELLGEIFGLSRVAEETAELDLPRKGGETVTVEMRMVEIVWQGEPVSLATLRDITDRKQAEQMRVLTQTAVGIAHEICQPLTVIIGMTEILLAQNALNGTEQSALEAVREAGKKISETIDKLRAVRQYVTMPYVDKIEMIDFNRTAQAQR